MIQRISFMMMLLVLSFGMNAQGLNENFEGATFPPTNWYSYHTLSGVSSAPVWTSSTTAQSGSKSAFLTWQPNPYGLKEDYLVSSQFTPTLTNHMISFWHKVSFPNNDGTQMQVRVSTDPTQANAITNFSTLQYYYDYQLPYQGFINNTIDLTPYIGQPIYLVFYVSQFNNGDNWYIDNITTTTTTGCTLNSSFNQSICQGGSFTFNGQNLTTAGTYYDTLTSVVGCDSIVALNLTVTQIVTNINESICQGASFVFNGQSLTTAGTYYDTLTTTSGCDSIIQLSLSVNQLKSSINHSLCEGQSVVFNGQTISTAGIYLDTFINALGCDSIVTMYVVVKPSISVTTPSNMYNTCLGSSVNLLAYDQQTSNYNYYFDGNSNLINAGNIAEMSGANTFTLEGMVYSYSNTVYKCIFSKRVGTNGFSLQFDQTVVGNGLVFFMGDANGYCIAHTPANSFTSSTWHHVAAVFDGAASGNANKLKIYIDGVQQSLNFIFGLGATALATKSMVNPSVPFIIGCENPTPASNICFSGFMDDVRIWDVARSATQITTSNNSCLHYQDNVGLVAEYNMNEGGNPSTIANNARPLYAATLVNANYNFSGNTVGCNLQVPGNAITFTGGIPNNTYVYPTDSTMYIATMISANGCADTAGITVNVGTSPLDSAVSSTSYACANSGFRLTAFTSEPYYYLYWKDASNNVLGYNSPFDITPSVAGWYTVTCGGANGCASTDSIFVMPDNGVGSAVTDLGNSQAVLTQANGSTLRYTDENCNSIAIVQDAPGGNTLGEVSATVTNLPTAGTYGGQAYVRRTYVITPSSQGAAIVTLYFTQADFDDYNANNGSNPDLPINPTDAAGISNIRITKVNGGALGIGTGIVIVPSNVIWNVANSNWEITFSVASFSEFFLHGVLPNNAPLPVHLLSFNVKKEATANVLQWNTAQEQNHAYFLVQRSTNAIDFATIGKIDANESQVGMKQYEFRDEQFSATTNYYRLQQVDIDGKTNQSEVVKIDREENGGVVNIYPNPASSMLNVECLLTQKGSITITISDLLGRILQETNTNKSIITLDLNQLTSGVYLLQVSRNQQIISTQKIEKR